MTDLLSLESLEEVLKKHNNPAKIHTLRAMETRRDLNGATVVELEVWRPVGSFQIVLEDTEVALYGEPGALDRYLHEHG